MEGYLQVGIAIVAVLVILLTAAGAFLVWLSDRFSRKLVQGRVEYFREMIRHGPHPARTEDRPPGGESGTLLM